MRSGLTVRPALPIRTRTPFAIFSVEKPRQAVAHHELNVEADLDARAVGAVIDRRKVAQDAALDLMALGADLDGLGDPQVAVALHLTSLMKRSIRSAAAPPRSRQPQIAMASARHTAHDIYDPWKTTDGVAGRGLRRPGRNASLNPPTRAISTSGNDWMPMLKSRTVPL